MTRYGALAGAADHRVGLLIGQPHAAAGIAFHQLQQLHHQVQPDVALRDHEPRQHALGVLFALPFRLRTDQRHDPQFVVAPVRTAHQPLAPGMDARLMPPPTQQARPPARGFGHRRQICLNVEACEFRMCQFSGGGHRVPGQEYRRWPLSLSPVSGIAPGRTYPMLPGGLVPNQELSLGGQQPTSSTASLIAARMFSPISLNLGGEFRRFNSRIVVIEAVRPMLSDQ